MCDREHIFAHLKRQAFIKCRVWVESFIEIDLQNRVCRDIGCLLVKSTMNIHIVFDHETYMSEAIDIW